MTVLNVNTTRNAFPTYAQVAHAGANSTHARLHYYKIETDVTGWFVLAPSNVTDSVLMDSVPQICFAQVES